ITATTLADHVTPPAIHRVEDDGEADQHGPDRRTMHIDHKADRRHEGAQCTHERPGARIDEMIIVFLGVGVSHVPSSPLQRTELTAALPIKPLNPVPVSGRGVSSESNASAS